MGRLLRKLRARFSKDDDDKEDEKPIDDHDAEGLSHVGAAAYEVLSKEHAKHHLRLWNVTTGSVIGEMDQTPKDLFGSSSPDPSEGHSDWFPEKMANMIKKTTTWCDVMSLGPPDGKFLEEMRDAITYVHRHAEDDGSPPIIRMMFGNIVGTYHIK